MSAWYDLPPSEYAKGLRIGADRSDECAARQRADAEGTSYTKPQPWRLHDAEHFARQARRLRAMALLCERSTVSTAGEVNFRRLHDPSMSLEEEDAIVADIETNPTALAAE